MPIMAKCTGSSPAERASGSRIVPTMMIAGIASRKTPPTRNKPATTKPDAAGPRIRGDRRAPRGDRTQERAHDDDRRDRVEEAAHDQEHARDEEARRDRAHLPGRH